MVEEVRALLSFCSICNLGAGAVLFAALAQPHEGASPERNKRAQGVGSFATSMAHGAAPKVFDAAGKKQKKAPVW